MSDATVERVLVVPRDLVPDRASWYGLRTDGMDAFLGVVADHGRFEPRAAMEVDPSFKQIIPYLVLRDGERYFLMRRTRAGGDARLHDRWSIGVGGHLDPGDDGLAGGLRREWREELVADFEPVFTPIALLNDDTTEVGAVHLGVVIRRRGRGPAGQRARDGQADRRVRDAGRGRRRRRASRDVEPARLRRARDGRHDAAPMIRRDGGGVGGRCGLDRRAARARPARRGPPARCTARRARRGGARPALDALGGEVIRLRSRDGLRLAGRWLPAERR